MNNKTDFSLEELRIQIDTIDQEIVLWLVSQKGERTLGSMIDDRLDIVREIARYKTLHDLSILDGNRRDEMIQSRVSWVPTSHQSLVQQFFEALHDISVLVQKEGKNLQK